MCPVLVADGVRKTYGDTVALDDVSLTISEGEVLALVGPNGAGKTTLLRSLTGTVTPDDGMIQVLGEDPASVRRDRLGVLPQAFSPPDRLTARELLHYYAGLYDDARDPDALLDSIGVADSGSTRYEHLSGGQQRRVCLGSALVNDPRVLLLDEPTTGIDPAGRRTVREQIASLADGGATILVTTHDMDEAERIADRVALLADGRIRATGTPSSLIDEHGGPPRVIVEVEDEVSSDDRAHVDSAATAIRERGFDCTTTGDGRVVVTDVRPEAIESIVAGLSAVDVSYEGLEWRRPELEDAYLEIAGEHVSADAVLSPDSARPADGRGGDGS
uniref:ABC transporter ATP-binding protein n=1 Tax=Salinarchaeum laminariae TaxID=869888 RepID=UPI0020BFCC6F|nr:ABC transporter ATP-binding protein [Salinarchaeum laminariae]